MRSLWGLSWRNHVVEKRVENTEKSSDILCKIMTRWKNELEFEKGKEDFLKEARSLSRFMKLPSIVSVRDFFQKNHTAYIVMEYVEGTRVRNYIRANGKMPGDEVFALMEPVIHSLCDIHKQDWSIVISALTIWCLTIMDNWNWLILGQPEM